MADHTNKRKLAGVEEEIVRMDKRPRKAITNGTTCMDVLIADGFTYTADSEHNEPTMKERMRLNPRGVERCKAFYHVQGTFLVRELIHRSETLRACSGIILGYVFPTWNIDIAEACLEKDGSVLRNNVIPYGWINDYR